jgi:hypothetical protein
MPPAATLSSFRQSIPQESMRSGAALRGALATCTCRAPHRAMVTALATGPASRTAARFRMLTAALTAGSLYCSQLLVSSSPAIPGPASEPDR